MRISQNFTRSQSACLLFVFGLVSAISFAFSPNVGARLKEWSRKTLNVSAPQPAASAGVLAASRRATATAGRGVAAFQTATAGQLIISEFRLRGPNGANDEFIEIENISGADHTVMAASGTGYGIAASNGVTRCSIPNGTVIPNHGHYLCVNSVGYSLASYPAGNGTTATGDATYTTDIPDNAGIAIFNNNTGGASYSLANRLDAVGSTSEANTTYKEGTGYPALTAFSIDYSFYRKVPGITGGITGTAIATGKDPVDTDNNAADFLFVDTNGTSAGAGQRLGAPGPQNLSSPLPLGTQQRALLDPCTAAGSAPNKIRDFTSDPANNSTFGTIDLRRTFTNNTGGQLTRLRFRIQDLTTFPAPSGVADLRPRTSSAVVVTVDRAPCGSGTSNVTVAGTQLEQPPSQPNGGGFNSSWSAGVVTLATPLANGASIDLRFLFGIQQTGFYRLGITMEGVPNAGGVWVLCGNTETSGDVEGGCIASSVNVTGTGGDDTLAVTATGANSGSYSLNGGAAVAFSGIASFAFDGMGGNDTLTINNPAGGLFAPSGGIDYNGGGQAGDKLEMLGGLAGSETYFVGTTTPPIGAGPGNNGSGLIRFTSPNLDLRFTGLAPIVDTVAAASLTVNATDAANTINVTNATTAPRLQIAVDAFEPIEFNNKTNVFVNGGDGAAGGDVADIINITSSNVPAALTTLTINGNEGADTVNALGKSGAYALNLNGGADDDTLMGSAGNETLDGGAGNDTFVGNGGADNIGAGSPDASADTILVPGTAAGDTISLAINSGNLLVTINGVTTTYSNFVGGAIATSGIDLVSVNADAGADTVNVNNTEAGIPTAVNTNAGTDTVNVLSTNATGPLTINTGSELDIVNIGNTGAVGAPGLLTPIASAVTLDGGADGANLTVDGSGAGVLADYAITSTTVTRSTPAGFGGVTYGNLASLLLATGSGANIISVNSTGVGVPTNITTGAGNDTVALANGVSLNGGTVDGGADADTLDYSAYTTSAAVNLGLSSTGLSGTVDGTQENPPQTATAAGTVIISNYNATAKTFDINVTVTDLPPASVTGFHIHRAPVGTNGPVIIDLQSLAALVPAGTGFTFTAMGVTLPVQHEAAFLGGVTYVNIHTAAAPGGLIRGQIFNDNVFVAANGTATDTGGVTNVENAIGGSGADSLVGNNDSNVLAGNAGNDTIVGGRGNDTMNGGDNNDILVWSNGDNNDLIDGNLGVDVVQVNGAVAGNDIFTAGANGARIAFARTNLVPFALDIGTIETLIVNGVGGDDNTTVNNLAGVADLTGVLVNGFVGNDIINVQNTSAVNTSFTGGAGDDTITLGNGATLNNGTVNGGANTDTLDYSAYTTSVAVNLGLGVTGLGGSIDGTQENPPTSATATGTVTISNYNAVTKTFDISATVSNLLPANVTGYHIHRAPVGTNGPIIIDLSSLFGLGALVPSGSGFTFNATGVTLPAQHEAAFLGGITYFNVHTAAFPGGEIRGQIFSNANVNLANGTATGTGSVSNVENVTGGSGADSLVGSFAANVLNGNAGNDTIVGGPGADTMTGGDNNDVLVWSNGDGSDIMDGQVGADVVQVNGSVTADDVFTIGANGTRIAFARVSPGPFTLDIGTTETLITNGIVGNDTVTVNSLAGIADLTEVRLRGFDGNDTFDLMSFPVAPLVVNVNGGPHAAGDTLNVNGGGLGVSDNGTVLTAPGSGTVNYNFIENKAFTSASALAISSPAAAAEGNAGTTAVTFTVSLSPPSAQTVMVNYATANGTATVADNDYAATNGTLTFNPGETSKPIIVNVNGDVKFEPNETFTVNLSGATNATITTAQGTGTINNDDNAPPTITAGAALTRQQGSAGTVSNIATVSDTETPVGNLVVTSAMVPAGMTITSITNTNGTIAANITADCAATVGANIIALTVTDAGGATAQANLTVNVAANTPPTLGTYATTTIDLAQTLSVTPSAAPSDNGTISSVTATASAEFTGTVTVVAATGVVTINSAAPAGNHTITITARDNCNAPTTQSFSLQIKNSFEGDVAPRPDGDGTLSVADWVMAGRFVVALDTPAAGSEFQRADCAPKATAGDGRISLIDWVQAGRYAAGLDSAVPRGGPTELVSPLSTATLAMQSSPDSAQQREIRVKAANFKRGQPNAMRLELSAQGDENALAFTLNFDPTQLSFVTASTPVGQTVASLTMNRTQASQGRIGIALILPSGQTFSAGLQELLDVQFIPAGGYTDTTTVIGFSDQIVHREAVDMSALSLAQPTFVNGNIAITGQAIASVSAASYVGFNGAAGAIFSSFGIGLTTTTVAATPGSPLPTALGGTTVRIKDSTGIERMASLFFASPQQINFQIPEDTAGGLASVTITNGNGDVSRGLLQIAGIAPGLFTANANGAGVAAANLVRVTPDQTQRYEDVAEYDPTQQKFVARAIEFGPDLGVNSDQLFLLLYGTGIRGRSALDVVSVTVDGMAVPVEYAGKHSQYAGLDQINIRLPRALRGRGEVSIVLQVEGQKANEIKVKFR